MDTRALGMAVVAMGGGRRQASDKIDYRVGLNEIVRLGEYVVPGQTLAVIHARDEASWQQAAETVKLALTVSDTTCQPMPEVYRMISQ